MEWYIIQDPQWGKFMIKANYYVMRDEKGACWKSTLDFTTTDRSNADVTSFLERNGRVIVLDKFISDDPISYVKNFQFSHPEFFI